MREKLVVSVYQSLLLDRTLKTTVEDNFENEAIDPYVYALVDRLEKDKGNYIQKIEPHLNHWSFARLAYMDQAILLVAMAELEEGVNDKAVIINEAVNIAKTYCDEDSFRYINSVLDHS